MLPIIRSKIIFLLVIATVAGVLFYAALTGFEREVFSYRFAENLDLAEAELASPDGVVQKARLDDRGPALLFENLPEWTAIYKKTDHFKSAVESRIFFTPYFQGFTRTLTFQEIPKRKKMLLIYGFSDSILRNKVADRVTLRCFLGGQLVLNQTLSPRPGLRRAEFSLDRYLPEDQALFSVSLQIVLDGSHIEWSHFYVDGYVW